MSEVLEVAEAETTRSTRALVRSFWELSKPGVTRLVLVTTGLGVAAAPEAFAWRDLLPTIFGTALVVAGANALNMFLERDSDRYMTRTSTRPLPSERMQPDAALLFGMVVSILGLGLLAHFVSMLAVALAAAALLSYVLVYTPLKRVSSIALYVGAVPGAMPPAIGYTAVTGSFDEVALSLFLVLFAWQIPHFLAITLFRHREYARAGLRVLPVERGVLHTQKATFWLSLAFLATTLVPVWLGVAGVPYLVVALVSGLAFSGFAWRGYSLAEDDEATRTRWSRALFFSSLPHLVLVMASLAASVI